MELWYMTRQKKKKKSTDEFGGAPTFQATRVTSFDVQKYPHAMSLKASSCLQ